MTLDDLFTVTSLTDSINKLPAVPGQVGAMNLFVEKGIRTTSALIDVKNGRLVLVENQSRNSEGQPMGANKRTAQSFQCAHLPLTDVILPDEIQDVRAFGGEATPDAQNLESQASVINDKLTTMKNSLEATREFHRVGALRGKILDSDGTTVIHDLYSAFGVTKKSVNVALSNQATNVRKACLDAKRYSEKKLGGFVVRGFRALCGSDWFDALISQENVKAAYEGYQAAQDRLGGDMRSGFTFGGIEFVESNMQVGNQLFIPADVAQVFPLAAGAFVTYNGPANYNEAVNTIGKPYYAKAEPRKMGKGWDLESQANPLSLCLVPEALVELKAT